MRASSDKERAIRFPRCRRGRVPHGYRTGKKSETRPGKQGHAERERNNPTAFSITADLTRASPPRPLALGSMGSRESSLAEISRKSLGQSPERKSGP